MENTDILAPIPSFQALDGCHCITSSYRKIYHFHNFAISEEMLFGLGAGIGFIYWHQKGQPPFLGGRGNVRDFSTDLGSRTGVEIREHATGSTQVAERQLLRLLESGEPVCLYADMAYLTYLGLPEDAHFGGHAIVVAGYDPQSRRVLISDIAAQQTGQKSGFLAPLSLEELAVARASRHQPFPPGNHWLTFDFTNRRVPAPGDLYDSIRQAAQAMLNPPIRNLGVAGIRTAAKRVERWPKDLSPDDLRTALFNLYVFVEIGGTGGGLFRLLYARFLAEAAQITGDARLADSARTFTALGERWTAMALPMQAAFEVQNPGEQVEPAARALAELAEMEQSAWEDLS
jgi:hypothetical protein